MVFSSLPLYLDPPNWQQNPNHQQLLAHNQNNANYHEQNKDHLISQQQQPQAQQLGIGGGIAAQQSRACSMSERARIAKIPPPEIPLKCPRCDSTNTKFCYYNNYSLTQPRHFCKTCRRYWTRGGALRNVPVGGGCRRNKRTSSKSSSGGGTVTSIKASVLSSVSSPSTLVNGERLLHNNILEQLGNDPRGINVNSMIGVGNNNSMSFMASLQNMAQLGGMSSNMGLFPFTGGSVNALNSQNTLPGLGQSPGRGNGSNNGNYNHQQNLECPQQQIQFPNFLSGSGFEIPSSFQNVRHHNSNNIQARQQQPPQQQQVEMNVDDNMSKVSGLSMTSAVKMEGNGQQGVNLPKQLMMGISNSTLSHDNNQFWGGGNMTNNNTIGVTTMWTDLSGLNSSSTSHLV